MVAAGRKLAIIVVNFASSALLSANLVRSANGAPDAIVVVIDNLSDVSERDRIRVLVADHGWIGGYPDANLGFGEGVNRGITLALEHGATDFLLLNPDASIDAESLAILAGVAAVDPSAVLAPKIVDSAGRTWFSGADLYLDDGATRSAGKRSQHPDSPTWPWLTGACLWISQEIWSSTGGFDPEYFLYWEDVDFSARASAAGARLLVIEGAVAVHDEGGTQRQDPSAAHAKSAGYYYYNIRNRLLFATRHLDDEHVRAWRRGTRAHAREVLLRGGRRQFLHPWAPLSAAIRGVRDARRIADRHLQREEVQ